MAKQYWVGEFYVDLSRNQISQLGESQTLPPKALLVLTHLAENRGKVVSYDELFDKVWPNSVVTPNTLQRCIAQLRKALGEDSKAQDIIKTHAKQGYSLECDVNWSVGDLPNSVSPGNSESTSESTTSDFASESQNETADKNTSKRFLLFSVIIAVLIVAAVLPQLRPPSPQMQLGELRYLTATDDKEYGGTYSPDGKYILFHRYPEKLCINAIWAKNVETMEETQLTSELGTYGRHNISPDGKTLAFIKQEDCTKPVTQNICYKLMTINFNDALREPQTPKELLNCQNSAIRKPIWMDQKQIAMLQTEDQQWQLIRHSLEDQSSSTVYSIEEGNIISYAWSVEQQLFAVTVQKNDGQQYLEMLFPDGSLKSSNRITLPATARRHHRVFPEFIPHSQQLVFGDGGNIYTLDYDGAATLANFQPDGGVGAPYFHPDGKRLLMIKGVYDSDVSRLSIADATFNHDQNDITSLTAFERSVNGEDYAKFQPNGDLIAYSSARTGNDQIWLLNGTSSRVLSEFPKRAFIENLFWNKAGTELLVQADRELHFLSLDAPQTTIDFPHPILRLFHWDSDNQKAIANISFNGIKQFVEIDLTTSEYAKINNKKIQWAAKNQDGLLVYVDHLDRFWLEGSLEDKLIEPLANQASDKRFVVGNDKIIGINKDFQLWSYDLETESFTIIAQMTNDVDYLTDLKDGELLVTFVVAAKKEVVELSLTE